VVVSEVMRDEWEMEYLTRVVGADASDYRIHPFQRRYALLGREATSPSQYPNMLLYEREGRRVMRNLMRSGGYQLALPQDGAHTGAYLGGIARRYGARVVTMDHGTITRPESAAFKEQREDEARRYGQPRQAVERLRDALYLRTLRRFTRVAVRSSDTFLVAGDEVQDTYVRRYGVSPGLIVRYPYWVDSARFTPPGDLERAEFRQRLNLPDRRVIISLISRLAAEKGFDLALDALEKALAMAGADAARNVGVVIAGSGPMRGRIEADIEARGLGQACLLFGEASAAQVADLLRVSDIFLYAGKRGTNYSVAVLEAMAAGCAVVATASPISNIRLLAEGRGVALSLPTDAREMAAALARLVVSEETRRSMGAAARAYVQERHSALALRRALWRATGWAPDLASLTSAAPEQLAEHERAR
jgi:glycosyltransferase involved in cell wall biosynthesis